MSFLVIPQHFIPASQQQFPFQATSRPGRLLDSFEACSWGDSWCHRPEVSQARRYPCNSHGRVGGERKLHDCKTNFYWLDSFGYHRISPRELLSPFLGKIVSVEGVVTKCASPPAVRRASSAEPTLNYCQAPVSVRKSQELLTFAKLPGMTLVYVNVFCRLIRGLSQELHHPGIQRCNFFDGGANKLRVPNKVSISFIPSHRISSQPKHQSRRLSAAGMRTEIC